MNTKKSTTENTPEVVLSIGMSAPTFSLPSTEGKEISSESLLGSRYVLYFYPKDMSSGCTTQAHEFTTLAEKFFAAGVQLFGISPDSIESHHKFIIKDSITFPLLSDQDHKVGLAFGVWVEKSMYGKKYMGINRSTFVIGTTGNIEITYLNVTPEGHAGCVLEDLEKIQ